MSVRNKCFKKRSIDNPYEIWVSTNGQWTWKVLKKYQSPYEENNNPNALWFCAVSSPFAFDNYEYGDVLVSDVTDNGVKINASCNGKNN